MYIACFDELAKKLPGPPTALILGDAYMTIQEVGTWASFLRELVKKWWEEVIICERR